MHEGVEAEPDHVGVACVDTDIERDGSRCRDGTIWHAGKNPPRGVPPLLRGHGTKYVADTLYI
jgi:hypothetical protein